jgi:hypothetical protein
MLEQLAKAADGLKADYATLTPAQRRRSTSARIRGLQAEMTSLRLAGTVTLARLGLTEVEGRRFLADNPEFGGYADRHRHLSMIGHRGAGYARRI